MKEANTMTEIVKVENPENIAEELIKVTQLPVIEEHLRLAKKYVDEIVADAMSLVCNEDTVQAVKAARADLNKTFADLEEQRKTVKAAVLDPYNRFEAVYKECVSNAFKQADADLKKKINDVEGEMKRRCEDGLREYFEELCAANHIDFVPFARAGVVVSMADAKAKTQPPKKLKEQLAQFIEGIVCDTKLLEAMDEAEEIMVEYKRTLDASGSVLTVRERHRRIAAEKEAKAAQEAARNHEAEAVKKVEAFAPAVEKEPEYRCQFTVTATKPQLKRLKNFMTMEGIKYE